MTKKWEFQNISDKINFKINTTWNYKEVDYMMIKADNPFGGSKSEQSLHCASVLPHEWLGFKSQPSNLHIM